MGPLCDTSGNIATEHAAAVVATAWLLSAPDGLPAHVWADCEAAVHGATGANKVAEGRGTHKLGTCLRCLQQCHEARPGLRTFNWVKGHSDNVFNALADSLANEARKGNVSSFLPPALLPLLAHPLLPWLWRIYSRTEALPPLWRQGLTRLLTLLPLSLFLARNLQVVNICPVLPGSSWQLTTARL